ncbi:MAG: DNA repair protein RecN [Alphaproteobacteria bacterium]|nr:DNA repair protein RecN [Alphaproteobacteria bacterium]OJV46593.1 MAG: DNA repair protein RecN [Alphaproteobacteria bacterium 43-37]
MFKQLSVRNVVLIESLDLNFDEGLTVFTGETGAGKSILLDALNLALGARAESGLIRNGASSASVTAVFQDVPKQVLEMMHSFGILYDPSEGLVVRRQISIDRSSKAYLNDVPVTVMTLRSIARFLLDIHGQFDALETPEDFRNAVDAFIDSPLRNEVTQTFVQWQEAAKEHASFVREMQQSSELHPQWMRAVRDIRELNILPDEVPNLENQKILLANTGKLNEILQGIDQSFGGVFAKFQSEGSRSLAKLASVNPDYQTYFDRFESATVDIQDIYDSVSAELEAIAAGASSLETIEARLFEIRSCARKYNCLPEELFQKCEDFQAKLDAIQDAEYRLSELAKKVSAAKAIYVEKASALSNERQKAALHITHSVQAELPGLKLPEAKFYVEILPLTEEKWSSFGVDDVRFVVVTNAGAKPGLIQSIASGGERSRLYLALKLAFSSVYPELCFVFDEVDSGIGGSVAAAVGERLKKLSTHGQVLVITHSPQVAVFAKNHWHIAKGLGKDQTTISSAKRLEPQERQEEIARMLSGESVSDEARAAAAQLLRNS